MSFFRVIARKQPVLTATVALFFLTAFALPASAQLSLELTVEDVVVQPGQTGVEIPVYLRNCCDTIAGFEIWLRLSHPLIAEFTLEPVTEGTLTEGWFFSTRSLGANNADLFIWANCGLPPFPLAINPQEGDIPLLKILANVHEEPDTIFGRTADILIEHDFLDYFSFSDQYGNSVGITYEEVIDTFYYACNNWSGDVCTDSTRVTHVSFPWDFFHIHTVSVPYVDTNAVQIYDGTLILGPCGNINCSAVLDVSDLTYFVDYMFAGGPAPCYWQIADCDSDGRITISDVTYIVSYLFQSGPPPICLPEES